MGKHTPQMQSLLSEFRFALQRIGRIPDASELHAALVDLCRDLGVPDELLPTKSLIEFRHELTRETDRGAALFAAAHLDHLLEALLRAFLVHDAEVANEVFSGTAALATFSMRIDMAYLLGLIPASVRRELHLIRKIRNDFAHSAATLHFSDEPIASRCRALKHPRLAERPRDLYIQSVMSVGGIIDAALLVDGPSRRCVAAPESQLASAESVVAMAGLLAESMQHGELEEPSRPSDESD